MPNELFIEKHVRRDGNDYGTAYLNLFPHGIAWPREEDTIFVKCCRGLANVFGFVDARAADLLEIETDPRKTFEMLADWERAWGLPDPCFPNAVTVEERRRMLLLVMRMLGGQSRAWFQYVSEHLGISGEIIHITEFSPYTCGISMCGDTSDIEFAASGTPDKMRWELGPPENRYFWTARAAEPELIWFRCGYGGPEEGLKEPNQPPEAAWTGGECGVDTHLQIIVAPDLDCLLNRWKPAHTELVYDYSELTDGGPWQGTP